MAKIHAGGSELATSILKVSKQANSHRHHVDLYDDSDDDHLSEFSDKKEDDGGDDKWETDTINTIQTTSSKYAQTHAQKREAMRQRIMREVMDKAMPDRHDIDMEVFTSSTKITKGGCLRQTLTLMGILPASLHDAITHNSIKQVNRAIKRMMEGKRKDPTLINAMNEEGRTPIIAATIMKKVDIMEVLVAQDCELNLPDANNGMTALMYAIVLELDYPIIAMLIEAGSDLNTPDARHMTPMMMAASSGNGRVMRLMVARMKHYEPDDQDENGWTALHHAAYGGDGTCTKLLLSQGADKTVKDVRGRRSIDIARHLDHGEVLSHLEDLKVCDITLLLNPLSVSLSSFTITLWP